MIYILIASVVTPTYDSHHLGWGNGLVNNPFSWTDDDNRSMRWLAVLL